MDTSDRLDTSDLVSLARAKVAEGRATSVGDKVRRFLSKNTSAHLSFRPSSVLRRQLHSARSAFMRATMRTGSAGSTWPRMRRRTRANGSIPCP